MAKINAPKGTHDLIGSEGRSYDYIIDICKGVADSYGFDPLNTPIFESLDLFKRGVGDATDVVKKEMYDFKDKGGRDIALRPEGTAGVVRAVISNKLYATNDLPLKLYYAGPMFRYERPQLGRFRQFHQFGVEVIGVTSLYHDIETILLALHTLQTLGFEEVVTKINHLSTSKTRETYKTKLKEYYKDHLDGMCEDCKVRYEQNPLRMLDCKVLHDIEISKKAPKISDFLTKEDKEELTKVQEIIEAFGFNVTVDHSLVRGLDYYSGIIFEFSYVPSSTKDYGAIGGGGRYTNLVSELGGPELVGTGFAFGIERLYSILEEEGKLETAHITDDVYIISKGETARFDAFQLLVNLRSRGIRAVTNYVDGSFKSLFKIAESRGAEYAIIIGEEEANKEVAQLRNLKDMSQKEVPYSDVVHQITHIVADKYGHEHHHHHDEEEGDHECACGHDHECKCDNHDEHECSCKHHEHHHDDENRKCKTEEQK